MTFHQPAYKDGMFINAIATLLSMLYDVCMYHFDSRWHFDVADRTEDQKKLSDFVILTKIHPEIQRIRGSTFIRRISHGSFH